MTEQPATFYSWRTTKNGTGTFSFKVTQNAPQSEPLPNGHYCETEIVKSGKGFGTRAAAARQANKWIRYLRASA